MVMREGYKLPGRCTEFTPPLLKLIVSDPHGLYGSDIATILVCILDSGARRTRILSMADNVDIHLSYLAGREGFTFEIGIEFQPQGCIKI